MPIPGGLAPHAPIAHARPISAPRVTLHVTRIARVPIPRGLALDVASLAHIISAREARRPPRMFALDPGLQCFLRTPPRGQANALMNEICQIDEMKAAFRYHSHTFVDKVKCRPVQAADILAWQGATNHKRAARGERRRRRDFRSLLELDTHGYHATEDRFVAFQSFLDGLPPGGIKDIVGNPGNRRRRDEGD